MGHSLVLQCLWRIRHPRIGPRKASFGAHRCPRWEVWRATIPSLVSQGASHCRLSPGREGDSANQLCVYSSGMLKIMFKFCLQQCEAGASAWAYHPQVTTLNAVTMDRARTWKFHFLPLQIHTVYLNIHYSSHWNPCPSQTACPPQSHTATPTLYSFEMPLK